MHSYTLNYKNPASGQQIIVIRAMTLTAAFEALTTLHPDVVMVRLVKAKG